jgi:hypothetical protein
MKAAVTERAEPGRSGLEVSRLACGTRYLDGPVGAGARLGHGVRGPGRQRRARRSPGGGHSRTASDNGRRPPTPLCPSYALFVPSRSRVAYTPLRRDSVAKAHRPSSSNPRGAGSTPARRTAFFRRLSERASHATPARAQARPGRRARAPLGTRRARSAPPPAGYETATPPRSPPPEARRGMASVTLSYELMETGG